MTSTQQKMAELDAKIQQLQQAKKHLQQQRCQYLATLLARLQLDQLEDEVLVGALLEIQQQTTHKTKAEGWRQAGRRFFRREPQSPATTPAATVEQVANHHESIASTTSA